jgi:thymidylate synthase
MAWKSIVTELLWFLRGDTNIKFLLDYDCHIWDGDAWKNYIDEFRRTCPKCPEITKEQFLNKIKTDAAFAKQWGELGPIYGKQWRNWSPNFGNVWGYDQILNLINELKTNPDSRRLMVSAWNVGELDQMVLPPCHYGFQVYTRELRLRERIDIAIEKGLTTKTAHLSEEDYWKWCDKKNIPNRAISLMWNQRSVDTFLGLPFNIASYGLILHIIANEVNMVPDELIGNLGDVHLYSNHIEQAKMQILRKPYSLPRVNITERNWYQHELVKERLGPKTFNDKILSYRPDCFELIGYESHSGIKAPLSN